ncbi:hypothetical protein HanPSC8_Chr10g0448701 [Helianthus annuus]|nr:hypothetical protein HanPSC8_Chr10g0448701 [Helianthus annuus]
MVPVSLFLSRCLLQVGFSRPAKMVSSMIRPVVLLHLTHYHLQQSKVVCQEAKW